MIILFLDTTNNKEVIVRLTVDEKVYEEKKAIENNRTQVVLPLIQQMLQQQRLTIRDIQKVEVNPGPGSFTGIRVGTSIANALIFTLGLPQNLVEGHYS